MARHSSPRHRSRSWTWSTGSSAIHRLPAEPAGRRSRDGSFAEQLLPPLAAFGSPVVARHGAHLAADLVDRPPGQLRQRVDFLIRARAEHLAIALGGLAPRLALPRVAQDVATLEVAAVRGLLEDQVFREVAPVVPDVQTRQEDVGRATAGDRTTAHAVAGSAGIRQPEDAELAQLVGRQGIRRARIAPGHVPRVLEEDGAHVLALDLLR